MTALREIKLLKELSHPNIIRLVDVFPHKRNLNLARTALCCPPQPSHVVARCSSLWRATWRRSSRTAACAWAPAT